MNTIALVAKSAGRDSARERILTAAYGLFSCQGTRCVGVDTVVARSGVAKMSLYRHFRSKQELVTAFLERRESVWTVDWFEREIAARAATPRDRLLAIFDALDGWFQSENYEGCSFINVLLEYPVGDPIHAAAVAHLATIRAIPLALAREAGIADPGDFADTWHMLMKGAVVAACEGNRKAALQAKRAAKAYLDTCGATGAG